MSRAIKVSTAWSYISAANSLTKPELMVRETRGQDKNKRNSTTKNWWSERPEDRTRTRGTAPQRTNGQTDPRPGQEQEEQHHQGLMDIETWGQNKNKRNSGTTKDCWTYRPEARTRTRGTAAPRNDGHTVPRPEQEEEEQQGSRNSRHKAWPCERNSSSTNIQRCFSQHASESIDSKASMFKLEKNKRL
jgi:hypothetical protein